MGREAECTLRYRGRNFPGKALLETDYVLFRGGQRLKIALRDIRSAEARAGILSLEFAGGRAELELGPAAEKWAGRIRHPPSRLDKLGVKPGLGVRLEGEFDDGFRAELREAGAVLEAAAPGLVVFAAETAAGLRRVPELAGALGPGAALWIVYPKGVTAIREMEVIEAGRAAGLKDVKVARFSETRTALKFGRPR
jgi:hypothetical protein